LSGDQDNEKDGSGEEKTHGEESMIVREERQSTETQYAESYVSGENSLEQIQFKLRPKKPSGIQLIGGKGKLDAEENELLYLETIGGERKKPLKEEHEGW
jgi:hypothetical protein